MRVAITVIVVCLLCIFAIADAKSKRRQNRQKKSMCKCKNHCKSVHRCARQTCSCAKGNHSCWISCLQGSDCRKAKCNKCIKRCTKKVQACTKKRCSVSCSRVLFQAAMRRPKCIKCTRKQCHFELTPS